MTQTSRVYNGVPQSLSTRTNGERHEDRVKHLMIMECPGDLGGSKLVMLAPGPIPLDICKLHAATYLHAGRAAHHLPVMRLQPAGFNDPMLGIQQCPTLGHLCLAWRKCSFLLNMSLTHCVALSCWSGLSMKGGCCVSLAEPVVPVAAAASVLGAGWASPSVERLSSSSSPATYGLMRT